MNNVKRYGHRTLPCGANNVNQFAKIYPLLKWCSLVFHSLNLIDGLKLINMLLKYISLRIKMFVNKYMYLWAVLKGTTFAIDVWLQ
jgi:hypothetical protein